MSAIVVLAANKGGVGKTTLAFELAYALDGVLVDLDWDQGGATRAWGFNPEEHEGAPLLDALGATGKVPTPLKATGRPLLVPSHPLLAEVAVTPDEVADKLTAWAAAWDHPCIVVDTHPGAAPLTYGAMAAAHLIGVPVVLGERELAALAGMLAEFDTYRFLLIPNRVPRWPDARQIDRLDHLAREYNVRVGPPVSEHRWLSRRRRHTALGSLTHPGARTAQAIAEFRAVAQAIEEELADGRH